MMKGVVSKGRDRKAECRHGDNNRLQFWGAPSCRATQQRTSEQFTSLRLSRTSNPTARIARGGERAALVKQLKRNRNVKPYLVWKESGTARERQRVWKAPEGRAPEPCPAGNSKQPLRQVRVKQLCFRLLSEEASSGKQRI